MSLFRAVSVFLHPFYSFSVVHGNRPLFVSLSPFPRRRSTSSPFLVLHPIRASYPVPAPPLPQLPSPPPCVLCLLYVITTTIIMSSGTPFSPDVGISHANFSAQQQTGSNSQQKQRRPSRWVPFLDPVHRELPWRTGTIIHRT